MMTMLPSDGGRASSDGDRASSDAIDSAMLPSDGDLVSL
jgi:hypothetical protein